MVREVRQLPELGLLRTMAATVALTAAISLERAVVELVDLLEMEPTALLEARLALVEVVVRQAVAWMGQYPLALLAALVVWRTILQQAAPEERVLV